MVSIRNIFMWSKFNGDLYNSGQSQVDLSKVKSNKVKFWTYKTDGLIWSSPILDEKDNIYLGSTEGCFFAISKSGKLIWKYEIPESLDSIIDSAACFGPKNSVIIPGGDGCLHCLDKKTGKRKWVFEAYHANQDDEKKHKVVNSFEGNVVYHDVLETIYAGSDNGVFYAIGADGKEKWNFVTGLMIWALPVFDEENRWLAIGSLDGYLYFLDPKTGQLLSKQYLAGEIKSTPAYDPETKKIFVCTSLGYLHCAKIFIQKKEVVWQKEWMVKFDAEVYSSPSYKNGKVVIGTMGGTIECCSFAGEKMWSLRTLSSIAASPIISKDGQVIVGSKNGKLWCVNLDNGELLWSYQTNSDQYRVNLDSSPAITKDGMVCVGSYDANLYCVSVKYAEEMYEKTKIGPRNIGKSTVKKQELVLDAKRMIGKDSHQLQSLFSPIKLKIADYEKGDLSHMVFSNNFKLDMFPAVDVESSLSSDRKYIYITPKNSWQPDTRYDLRIKAKTTNNASLIKKIFSSGEVLDSNLHFDTPLLRNDDEFKIDKDKILMHSFYIHSPTLLETYAAAAFFHQKLLVNFSKLDQFKNILNALITPYEKGSKEQSFELAGEHIGDHFRLIGNFDISVMGATLSVSKFYLASNVDANNEIQKEADLIFQIPILSIKENNKNFKFPSGLLTDIVDLRFKIVGSAECKLSLFS